MRKEVVTVRRADILKEMAIKFGIYEDFDINEFMSIAAGVMLETDSKESPYYGFDFGVVDDDYQIKDVDLKFTPELFANNT